MSDLKSARPITVNSLYISDVQFAERIGVHRVTIWRRAREECDFPKAIRLSPGCSRWRLTDIQAWETTKAA